MGFERPQARPICRRCCFDPDPWQLEILDGNHKRILLNCCRQAGKTTTVAMLALIEAIVEPYSNVILLSRSFRQSTEIYNKIKFFHFCLNSKLAKKVNAHEMRFSNESRIFCLPCRDDTIRGFSNVSLLVIDEAARVPDNLYRTVRPMVAVSGGRIVCLSTPNGRRGFFYREWTGGGEDWHRVEIPATQVPRIKPEFLEAERRSLGEAWFRQEYLCSFEGQEGLVFPSLRGCLVEQLPQGFPDRAPKLLLPAGNYHGEWHDDLYERQPIVGDWVGGIDFGFRNPFAAVWGLKDHDDVLWLLGEHYQAQQPLAHHATMLPRAVLWHADPAGAGDIAHLRAGDFHIRKGVNALATGIAAVTHRINTDGLKILKGRCPHLLREADLYRWPAPGAGGGGEEGAKETRTSEVPIDANNHALSALRYLVATLDKGKRLVPPVQGEMPPKPPGVDPVDDERYWREVG